MTIIETAKLNNLDPQAYLADIFERIHDHKINKLDELPPLQRDKQSENRVLTQIVALHSMELESTTPSDRQSSGISRSINEACTVKGGAI